MQIRKAFAPEDITQAALIDEAHVGSNCRADHIASAAKAGGLRVAALHGEIKGFCCVGHGYFFEKPFVSLLIISPDARRLGLGEGLLSHSTSAHSEVWTSTNKSNSAMRSLLAKAGWQYCGELRGLDDGDPELFFKTA